jgi:hypothetical protein
MVAAMTDAYFTTRDGVWFRPTGYTRGPWDAEACHAGPPAALLVRAIENLAGGQQLVRINVELRKPIPMAGFRVQGEVRRPGRSVTFTEAEIFDEDHIYARAFGMHIRRLDAMEVTTAEVKAPRFEDAVAADFPVRPIAHDLLAFPSSLEVRYDPEGSLGQGGPTTMWVRNKVPILAGEQPTPFQMICPLADSGNGISYNDYLDKVSFVNPDLTLTLHREPVGEWFCSRAISHWQPNGIGVADAELFDTDGPVGRAVQSLLLAPAR